MMDRTEEEKRLEAEAFEAMGRGFGRQEKEKQKEETGTFYASLTDMPDEPTPKPLVGEWLRERSYNILYSRAGSGKTALGGEMVHAMKTGEKWLGQSTADPGSIVWVNGDLPGWQVKERLSFIGSMSSFHHCPQKNMWTTQGRDLLWHLSEAFDFMVLDNLAALFDLADMNAAENWRYFNAYMRMIAENDCAILLMTHEGKGEGTSSFGSSAQEWVADNILRASTYNPPMTGKNALDEDDPKTLATKKVVWVKNRLSAPPEDCHFRIGPHVTSSGMTGDGVRAICCD